MHLSVVVEVHQLGTSNSPCVSHTKVQNANGFREKSATIGKACH
jgi:hypothetical protein